VTKSGLAKLLSLDWSDGRPRASEYAESRADHGLENVRRSLTQWNNGGSERMRISGFYRVKEAL